MENNISTENLEQELNLRAVLDNYLTHWKWFLLGVLVSLSIAFVYLRYSIPQYQASATILVKDEKKGGMLSELSAFADMGLLTGMKSNVDNEIEILNSITLVEKTVQRLKFTTTYFKPGNFRDVEVYKAAQPFEFGIENASQIFYKTPQTFFVKILSEHSFELKNATKSSLGTFNFGATMVLKEVKIKIQKLPNFNTVAPIGETYTV